MEKFCMNCGTKLAEGEKFCPNCGASNQEEKPVAAQESTTQTTVNYNTTTTTVENNYEQPKKTSGLAIASMVCGIVGVFIFNIWLGITAICLSIPAKNRIKVMGNEKGKGMATAGLVLGIVDVSLGIISALITLSMYSYLW